MRNGSKQTEPGYADVADWLVNGPYRAMLTASRAAEASTVLLARTDQPAGDYPDPAVPNYSVILLTAGRGCEGRADMGSGRQTFAMLPGAVGVAPPDTACDYTQHGPNGLQVVGIPKSVVAALSEQATGRPVADLGPCHQFFRDPLVERLCLRMWAEAGGDPSTAALACDATLTALVSALLVRAGRPPKPLVRTNPLVGPRLTRVIDYVHDNLDAGIRLADLAAVARLSEFHFARLFERSVGLAPHQYVIAQRVERAKTLIAEGRLTLAMIAAEVGFADQAHLTRHFKALVGCTPGRFS